MADLVAWLTQILDEDEKRVQGALSADYLGEKPRFYGVDTGAHRDDWGLHTFHVAPERVLADIAAKRAIIALHDDQHECSDLSASDWPYLGCQTLRLLASAYADRPGYRDEWRP